MLKRGIVGVIAVVAILAFGKTFSMAQRSDRVPIQQANSRIDGEVDPMKAVESFLTRNRKEADDSIKALTSEAEVLRGRLQKVEAALARWEAVAGSLNQVSGESAGLPTPEKGSRMRWKQAEQDAVLPKVVEPSLPPPGVIGPANPIDPPPLLPDPAAPDPQLQAIPPPKS